MARAATRIGPIVDTETGDVEWVEQGDEIPEHIIGRLVEREPGSLILGEGARSLPEPDPTFSLADATVGQIETYIRGQDEPHIVARRVLEWEQDFKRRKGVIAFCQMVIDAGGVDDQGDG